MTDRQINSKKKLIVYCVQLKNRIYIHSNLKYTQALVAFDRTYELSLIGFLSWRCDFVIRKVHSYNDDAEYTRHHYERHRRRHRVQMCINIPEIISNETQRLN